MHELLPEGEDLRRAAKMRFHLPPLPRFQVIGMTEFAPASMDMLDSDVKSSSAKRKGALYRRKKGSYDCREVQLQRWKRRGVVPGMRGEGIFLLVRYVRP